MSYFNHSFVKTFLPIRTNVDLMNNVSATNGDHITAADAAGTAGMLATIDGDRFPGFIQVKRMIKALEIIAEGEQEVMLKE